MSLLPLDQQSRVVVNSFRLKKKSPRPDFFREMEINFFRKGFTLVYTAGLRSANVRNPKIIIKTATARQQSAAVAFRAPSVCGSLSKAVAAACTRAPLVIIVIIIIVFIVLLLHNARRIPSSITRVT